MTPTLLLLAACGGPPEPAELELGTPTAAPVPGIVQRGWRRMDLEQLDNSIRKVTGITWTDERGNNQFTELAGTLGAADYRTGKHEDLSVNLLFIKFLEDAAADVCTELVTRESTPGGDPVFLVYASVDDTWDSHPDAVRENLAHALLRFHGRSVSPTDAQLEPWSFLFASGSLVTGSPLEGWRTVCIGLLTHPDFYTY